jgi:Mn2+/Fe2+ NRAMP family transporter
VVEERLQSPARSRQSAVLDDAHVGDIRGAFGTLHEPERGAGRTWRQRLLALAVIIGPGLIVMVGDNDAGGVWTYAQAGDQYGTSLLWVLVLLIPVLIVNQEMVVRLGAVTGVGHGRLIFERFGKFWGWFSVGDLFLLNFLTIVTEFIGIGLGAAYFGVSADFAVPIGAALLVGITVTGRFETWERLMFAILAGNALVIPLMVLVHPSAGPVLHGLVVPGIQGGLSSDGALLVVAIVGTTVAPWQLFFQQSNVIDKRITPRWINYERADTVIGAFVVVIGAAALIITAATAFQGTPAFGHLHDARMVAEQLARQVSTTAGDLFAIVLIDASVIGASAVTLATSYAFGDVFGIRHSLHRSWREAKPFYATFTGVVIVAAGIVLIPGAPLGLITTAVQALAGTLLPAASLFLLLLCNDRAVLGPWSNRPWLNILATVIIAVLVMLSMVLVISTIFPSIDIPILLVVLAGILVLALAVIGVLTRGSLAPAVTPQEREERATWRMPPIALLTRPVPSLGRRIGMWSMGGYVALAILLLFVKAIQLAIGH